MLKRKTYFFPVEIFRGLNRFFDSLCNAESRDITILIRFPTDPNCVGGANMRGCSLMNAYLLFITPKLEKSSEFEQFIA